MTGSKLVSGCNNSKAAKKFVHELAVVIRQKLAEKLGSCFFSILTDGSQPRKTGQEKELVMARIVDEGLPKYYVVGLIDMDNYGNANSDNLKKAIDNLFLVQLNLPEDAFIHQMISATSDGASVNTGCNNGLFIQLQQNQNWLVTIHCVSHRLELALKDCLLKDNRFKEMKDFMVILYYHFKKSGKLKRQFKELAKAMNVTIYAFPKVHGTRFINHVRRGLENLLNNWPVLKECIENTVESRDFNCTRAKLQGILKKLKNFKFLACCAAIKSLLDGIAGLSLALEQGDLQFFYLPYLVDITMDSLDAVTSQNLDQFLEHSNMKITDEMVQWSLTAAGDKRKKEENRMSCQFTIPLDSMTFVSVSTDVIASMVPSMITSVKECIHARLNFDEKASELSKALSWVDPANWSDRDTEEVKMMLSLYEQFKEPLNKVNFSPAPLEKEWRQFKIAAKHYCRNFKCRQLWATMLVHRGSKFPNVCKLASLALCIEPSNSIVEKSFSILNAMLNDRRMSMRAETMEDLFIIQANQYVWSAPETDDIVNVAVDNYLSCKRKTKQHEEDQEETARTCAFNSFGQNLENLSNSKSVDVDECSFSDDDNDEDEVVILEEEEQEMVEQWDGGE
jgi:hypothetical protein